MLSSEDSEILTRVGPGTLMGNLLRRYWTPALLSKEVPELNSPPVRVKLLGEHLVAFRDMTGRVGLIDVDCPHRGTSLFFGRKEEDGLRCVYHGWKFDVDGNCIDMPSEPPNSAFKEKLKVQSYPTHESGGIVWTYMGPRETMTGFRDFGTEGLPREKWNARKQLWPLSWLPVMENGNDTTHPSWLHWWSGGADLPDDGSDVPGTFNSVNGQWRIWLYDRAPRVDVVDTWHGFRAAGLRNTPNGNVHARLYQFTPPYTSGPSGNFWVVPADDNEALTFGFTTVTTELWNDLTVGKNIGGDFGFSVPGSPYAEKSPERTMQNDWLIDRDLQMNGSVYTGIADFTSQDRMAIHTMSGNRAKEHLSTLDRKIIRVRRILLDAAKNLAMGVEPPAIDPSLPYYSIAMPSKVIGKDDDWKQLGTELDEDFRHVRDRAAPLAIIAG